MRILMFSGYSHPSHHRKAELLADAPDVDLVHILQPGNGKETGRHASANGQRTYQVYVLPVRSLGKPGDPHRTIHWPPRFGLSTFKPDLIHCEHEQEGLMAVEVAIARQWAAPGVPLILYSWQNILRRRGWLVRQASAFTLRSAQHIICASHEGVSVLTRQGYRGSSSVQPLFGLDTRFFQPRPNPERRAHLNLANCVVGYVGRLVPEKGVDLLVQAVARVEAPLQALIIGSGPEGPRLQALACDLGIEARCRFIEAVSYDAVPDYLSLMDILVLPSRTTPSWKEQYGRVLVEAMACKVAVVGSSSGAIPEVICQAGRIFPEGDVAALARVLGELADAPAERSALAERGYQRAVQNYTVERLAADILELWRQLRQP